MALSTRSTSALPIKARKAELWRRGRLRWKLYPDQQEIYDWIDAAGDGVIVVNISRQYGKSFIAATKSDEFARAKPHQLVRFVTGSQKALRKIVQPIFREIWSDCPPSFRPRWNAVDSCYVYPNGSEIHMAGANDGHADDSRGQRAHLCVVDEAGFVDDLDYLVTSVLLPQTLTTGGRVLLISTPPITPSHAFVQFAARAEARGSYIVRTIDDNRHLTDQAKDRLVSELGGRQATQAQRELWCRFVVDESRAVVPEWEDAKDKIAVGWPRPPYFEPFESQDPGFAPSNWAVLFGYYDFHAGKFIVEDELEYQRARTDTVAGGIKAKEAELWPGRKVEYRYSDIDPILLNDLGAMHELYFAATSKDNLDAMVNQVRIWVREDRLRINPRCKGLLAQLRTAIWNRQRTQFDYSGAFGHYDLLAALVYAVRNAPVQANPYPQIPDGVTVQTHFIPPELRERNDDVARAALRIMGRR